MLENEQGIDIGARIVQQIEPMQLPAVGFGVLPLARRAYRAAPLCALQSPLHGRSVPYRPKRGRLADLSRPKRLDTARVAGAGGVCNDGRAVALRHAKPHQPATPCPALRRTA